MSRDQERLLQSRTRIGCGRWTSIHPLPSLLIFLSVLIPTLLSRFPNLLLEEIGRRKLEASRSAIDYMNSRTSYTCS